MFPLAIHLRCAVSAFAFTPGQIGRGQGPEPRVNRTSWKQITQKWTKWKHQNTSKYFPTPKCYPCLTSNWISVSGVPRMHGASANAGVDLNPVSVSSDESHERIPGTKLLERKFCAYAIICLWARCGVKESPPLVAVCSSHLPKNRISAKIANRRGRVCTT